MSFFRVASVSVLFVCVAQVARFGYYKNGLNSYFAGCETGGTAFEATSGIRTTIGAGGGTSPGGICRALFDNGSSPAALWRNNVDRIFRASQNPNVPQYANATQLFDILSSSGVLTTDRLRQGLRTRPASEPSNQAAALKRVLDKIDGRLAATDDSDVDESELVHVAVFGGSVTVGRGCWPESRGLVNRQCSWPRRLELLVNQLAGKDIVRVHNLAVGGTGTEQGIVFVKYWMYPSNAESRVLRELGPDVIINSYSTNDSLPPWGMTEGVADELLLRNREKQQEFIRTAMLSRPCDPPLVLHMDDYLGHQSPESILGELSYRQAVYQVASWYGTMFVSYADAVRDLVYRDTKETTFSPQWVHPKTGEYQVEVHFGYQAHAAAAWVLAYSFLEVLYDHCQDSAHSATAESGDAAVENIARRLPPMLTDDLRIADVSQKWEQDAAAVTGAASVDCTAVASPAAHSAADGGNGTSTDSSSSLNPCEMTWLASPTGIFQAGALNRFMDKYITDTNGGWGVATDMKRDGWKNKLGWEALTPKDKKGNPASFTMKLGPLKKSVSAITIFYMRSYGEKWAKSTARFTVASLSGSSAAPATIDERDLLGYHNSNTSISYTERIELPQAVPVGDSVTLRVDLTGGTTFKISGMMFCSV